jgi:pilus assembly protein Flp/PilA
MFSKINEAILRMLAFAKDEEGQALAEYGLILGLIAIAAIIALGLLGTALAGQLGEVTDALDGVVSGGSS